MSHPTDAQRKKTWPWIRRAALGAVLLFSAWLLYCAGSAVYMFTTLPAAGLRPGRASMVYAADGSAIGPLTGDVYQVPVDIAELPAHVGQAFVASEDIRFYRHHGVDPRGIARALLTNLRERTIAEGGSTITQQVVKNTFLTPRQTLTRKVQEAVLALLLETRYEKDEILGLYLNQLYMGHGTYGVGAAAQLYFNKDARDLTVGEAATLAGIAPAPESFSPLRDPEVAEERRDLVLDRMVTAGYLTPEEAEAEKALPLNVVQGELDLSNPHPWYMDQVRAELKERWGLDAQVVALMGLEIHTGLDPAMQQAAEERLAARIFPAYTPDGVEAAFAAVDPRTGEVRALVGGREYPAGGGLNRAVHGRIAPGSVLKPVLVYAPAIEYEGLTADSVVVDEPIDINGWQPQNWDFQFRGEATLREAARLSLNIPAIKLLDQVGVERAKAFAERLGIRFSEADRDLTLALGAMDEGVSPLEMAAAYQAFANGGTWREPHTITRVVAAGSELRGRAAETRRAMSPETAHAVTDILRTVVTQGTGTGALIGRPMAGKTGSVELPPDPAFEGLSGNSAAWFVGYTPDVVACVWVGYDQVDPEHYLPPDVNGSTYPTMLWRQVVGTALAGRPVLDFPGPDGGPAQVVETPAPAEPAEPEPQEPARPVLPQITGLAASPGPQPGSVNLTWKAEGGDVPAENLRFLILRGTEAGVPADEAHTLAEVAASPYLDVLTQAGTYYYRVVAVDAATGTLGEPSAPLEVTVELEDTGGGRPGDGQNPGDGGKPGDEEPGDGEPGNGGPGDAEPGDGEPGGDEPGDGEPGNGPGDGEPGGDWPDDGEPGDGEPGDSSNQGSDGAGNGSPA